MGGLKHVPVGEDVEVLREQAVVSVAEDVPGVRGIYLREEVITVDFVSGRIKAGLRYQSNKRTCYGPAGVACYAAAGCGRVSRETATCS